MRNKKLAIVIAIAVLLGALVLTGSTAGVAPTIQEMSVVPTPSAAAAPKVSPSTFYESPPGVLPVVYVSGTEYEMGFQYGQQAGGYIEIVKDGLWASLLARYDKSTILDKLAEYEKYVKGLSEVDFVSMMKGIANGARASGFDVSYEDILLVNYQVELEWLPLPESSCSNVAVWGNATADGKTITGSNFDFPWGNGYAYGVILVAYPSHGNAYVTVAIAGMLNSNFVMNDKGLVCMSNKSANTRVNEDIGFGVTDFILESYVAMTCSTAEEAKDTLLSVRSSNGINHLVVDESGHGYVVEATAALSAAREPGDFGEEDYLIATNHFIIPEMEPAQVPWEPKDYYPSSWYRYITIEKYIEDNYGNVDVDTVKSIMSSTDYWDGAGWHYDVGWSGNTVNRFPGATLTSKVAIPADRTVYICTGNPNTSFWGGGAPGQTGQYVKLCLGDSPYATANAMKAAAYSAIMSLAMDTASLNVEEEMSIPEIDAIEEDFNLVRDQYWEGVRYFVVASLTKGPQDALAIYGKACTDFSEAQAGAERLEQLLNR
jgi:hypothetical protein